MRSKPMLHKAILVLLSLPVLLTACGSTADKATTLPSEAVATSTVTVETAPETPDLETPTQTPEFIPAPTARPLLEVSTSADGLYVNDFYGLTFNYPQDWEILVNSQTDFELFLTVDRSKPVYIYMTTYVLEEDAEIEQDIHDYMDIMAENLSLPKAGTQTLTADYALNDDLSLWYGEQRVSLDSGDWVNEIYAYDRAGRMFTLWLMGYEDYFGMNQFELSLVKDSLAFYAPSPYGVDRENALFLAGGEPNTLDPALHQGSADSYIGDLFSGLVRLGTNLQIIPDLAEGWDLSPDGTVYTFYLRQNVRFHNGKAFTADDVAFSLNRAVAPSLHSPTASTYLNDIVGVADVLAGTADSISGIRILNEYTIEITLDAPKAYFLYKLAYPTSWIVDQETVESIDSEPNGTGPFKLVKHEENEIMIMARNAYYHGGQVPLEYIVYLLYQGPSIRLYEGGLIDMIGISEDYLSRAEDPTDPLFGTVIPSNDLCTSYALMDMSMPPFDDPDVRLAFALAVDKEHFNDVVNEGKAVVANGLYPPGLPGFSPDTVPISFNPEEARIALSRSSYADPGSMPEIVFTTAGSGGGVYPSVAVLVEMWQENLGVNITIEQIEPSAYRNQVLAGKHGALLSEGWCADYPDPENFADVLFHSGNGMNVSHFSDPEIDDLLEQARGMVDVNQRMALYHQIEQMLVDRVAAIFLSHSSAYYILTKPYVQNVVGVPIGVAQTMTITIEH